MNASVVVRWRRPEQWENIHKLHFLLSLEMSFCQYEVFDESISQGQKPKGMDMTKTCIFSKLREERSSSGVGSLLIKGQNLKKRSNDSPGAQSLCMIHLVFYLIVKPINIETFPPIPLLWPPACPNLRTEGWKDGQNKGQTKTFGKRLTFGRTNISYRDA